MNRREFMAMLAAGAVVTAEEVWLPGRKLISIPKKKVITDTFSGTISGDLFKLNYTDRTIEYIGDPQSSATVLELHRYLQDRADNWYHEGIDTLSILDPTPSSRAADNIIELHDNWHITNPEYLSGGSLQQRGELWTGIQSIGKIPEDAWVRINGEPAVRPGHVNQCVKITDTVKLEVDVPGQTYASFDIKSPKHGSNFGALCTADYYEGGPVDRYGKLKPEFSEPNQVIPRIKDKYG